MRLGYNTNGLAHHRPLDALDLLAEAGFQSVALTLDAGVLDPYSDPTDLNRQVTAVRDRLDRLGLARVIETGARYLLNPRQKHDPTLLDPDPGRRELRVDFLRRSIELAAQVGAPLISFWSGRLPDEAPDSVAFDRLASGIATLLRHAERHGIDLAFEPEPGMFIDTFARFARLDVLVAHERFQLTVDVGHVHCIEEGSAADHLLAWGPRIRNVHIEDMVRGVHDHLMFGEGTIDFPSVIAALKAVEYAGGLYVELSRHSHMAVEAVRRSAEFLGPLLVTEDARGVTTMGVSTGVLRPSARVRNGRPCEPAWFEISSDARAAVPHARQRPRVAPAGSRRSLIPSTARRSSRTGPRTRALGDDSLVVARPFSRPRTRSSCVRHPRGHLPRSRAAVPAGCSRDGARSMPAATAEPERSERARISAELPRRLRTPTI